MTRKYCMWTFEWIHSRAMTVRSTGRPRAARRARRRGDVAKGDEIVLAATGRRRADRGGRRAVPGARRADQDPRRPPDLRAAASTSTPRAARPQPSYFLKPPTTLNGHRGAVRRPAGTRFLNYEGELAVVIGERMHGVGEDDALALRRRLHVRERRRAARLPPRRPRLDAARQGPGRLPAARPGAGPGGGVRPHRLHPAHVPQRRGRPGGAGPTTCSSASPTSSPTCRG